MESLKEKDIFEQLIYAADYDVSLHYWSETRNILYAAWWHVKNPFRNENYFLSGSTIPEGNTAFYLKS